MAFVITPDPSAVGTDYCIERLPQGDVLARNVESFLTVIRASTWPFQTREQADILPGSIYVEFGPTLFYLRQLQELGDGKIQVSLFQLERLNLEANNGG